MREHAVEWARYAAQVKRLDQGRRQSDLPVGQEAAELFLGTPFAMRELLLVGAKRTQYPVRLQDRLDDGGAKATDQLVLQIGLADVEAEALHLGTAEIETEAGPLESTPQPALFARVAETSEPDARPARSIPAQEPAERLRAPDRHDRYALGHEISAAPSREGLERKLVADTFNQHDCTWTLDPARLCAVQRSRTKLSCGRAQQMNALPSAGGSTGSGL